MTIEDALLLDNPEERVEADVNDSARCLERHMELDRKLQAAGNETDAQRYERGKLIRHVRDHLN